MKGNQYTTMSLLAAAFTVMVPVSWLLLMGVLDRPGSRHIAISFSDHTLIPLLFFVPIGILTTVALLLKSMALHKSQTDSQRTS